MSAVACGSLSQRCQWLSLVRQSKLTKVHFKTRELFLVSIAACDKTLALPHWIGLGELGPFIISDGVKTI